MDNPGWTIRIDLEGTALEDQDFTPCEYGVEPNSALEDQDWWAAKVEDRKFIGFSGPHHLETLLKIFLEWADK